MTMPKIVNEFMKCQSGLEEAKKLQLRWQDFPCIFAHLFMPYYNVPSRGAMQRLYERLKQSVAACLQHGLELDGDYVILRMSRDAGMVIRIGADSLQAVSDYFDTKRNTRTEPVDPSLAFYDADAASMAVVRERYSSIRECEHEHYQIMNARDLLLECSATADTSVFDAKLNEISDKLLKLRQSSVAAPYHVLFSLVPITVIGGDVRGEIQRFQYRMPDGTSGTSNFK